MRSSICSRCHDAPRYRKSSYCQACMAIYNKARPKPPRKPRRPARPVDGTETEQQLRAEHGCYAEITVWLTDVGGPLRCRRCHRDGGLEMHRDHTYRQLFAVWLCDGCHQQIHRELAATPRVP